jgi:hypothetical protein
VTKCRCQVECFVQGSIISSPSPSLTLSRQAAERRPDWNMLISSTLYKAIIVPGFQHSKSRHLSSCILRKFLPKAAVVESVAALNQRSYLPKWSYMIFNVSGLKWRETDPVYLGYLRRQRERVRIRYVTGNISS